MVSIKYFPVTGNQYLPLDKYYRDALPAYETLKNHETPLLEVDEQPRTNMQFERNLKHQLFKNKIAGLKEKFNTTSVKEAISKEIESARPRQIPDFEGALQPHSVRELPENFDAGKSLIRSNNPWGTSGFMRLQKQGGKLTEVWTPFN